MPNFTHTEITPDNDALLDEAYQFGVANPNDAAWACGPGPYILRDELQRLAEDDQITLVAIYDETGMRMVTSFRNSDGLLGHTVYKRYAAPGATTPHPSGIELSRYQAALAVSKAGTVRTVDDYAEYHAQVRDGL